MNSRHTITLTAGLAALLLAGCGRKDATPTPAASGEPNPAGTVDRMSETVREKAAALGDSLARAWDQAKDATYDEREQAQAALKQLEISVDAKVSELQARSASATDATRAKWNEGIARLRSARTDLEGEIRDLSSATAETWDQAQAEVAGAWERLRQAFADLESQPAAL